MEAKQSALRDEQTDAMSAIQNPAGFVSRAVVHSIESPALEGEKFSTVGRYELLKGRAFCQLDPGHALNRRIVHLAHAPRNHAGMVEYDFDFAVLRPADPDRANGWLFYELPNRGNKLAVGRINGVVAANEIARRQDAGDGLLMRSGFTIVWSAWQGDVSSGAGRMLARLPIARLDSGPLTGRSRDEFILEPNPISDAITKLPGNRFMARLSYPAATLDAGDAVLTVRQRERDERSRPADLAWQFRDPAHIEVACPAGFDEGALYEFTYTARDPIVMGIGLAAVRDFVSFLRHEPADREGNSNPLGQGRAALRHTLGFGASQSGRVLRDFLYEGFNIDSRGRRVFDAVLPVVTGARGSFVNAPFAQPGRFSRQHEDHSYAGDQFPFSYACSHDRLSGRTDGLLERAVESASVPKIMHLEVETELWAGRSSLLVTDTQGRDLELPADVRLYMASGIPHATNAPPPGLTRYAHNALPYAYPLRAVLIALTEWVEHGTTPPDSVFPSRARGTLVEAEAARRQFPAIPGVEYPLVFNALRLKDHSVEPPEEGAAYPVYLASTDRDGNSLGGIRHPLLEAPIATLTGWMTRAPGYAEGELYTIVGALFSFPVSAEERQRTGDSRPSLQERYGSPEAWSAAIEAAAARLVGQRLLLAEDAASLVKAAKKGWAFAHFL